MQSAAEMPPFVQADADGKNVTETVAE